MESRESSSNCSFTCQNKTVVGPHQYYFTLSLAQTSLFLKVEKGTPSNRGLYKTLWISGPTVKAHIGKFGTIKLSWPRKLKNGVHEQKAYMARAYPGFFTMKHA